MATEDLTQLARPNDLIRIVPLHVPDEVTAGVVGAPAAAPPHLTYRGGQLLSAVKVFTVFWGSTWFRRPSRACSARSTASSTTFSPAR